MSYKVFIGVGHGGNDSGAIYNGLKEKDIVLPIALEVKKILKNHGLMVLLSREQDENDSIQEEVREENNFKSDICIDIHINAGGGNGFEVFHHHKGGRSKILAQNIEQEIKSIGQNSRGCKTKVNSSGKDYFMFIRETIGSAVIVECAFIDTDDIYIIDEEHEQKGFGQAIAKGALKTLGINYNEVGNNNGNNNSNENSNNSNSSGFYRVVIGSFKEKSNALSQENALKQKGINSFLAFEDGYYRVIAGSYKNKNNADNKLDELQSIGFNDSFLAFHNS